MVSLGKEGKLSHNTADTKDAIDFDLPKGTPLVAIADGTVVMASDVVKPGMTCYEGGGDECRNQTNYVVVRHAGASDSLYTQLATVAVKAGDTVRRGQPIGMVGSTGDSTGPHAHVQLQERCGTFRCKTVPLAFADVPNGGTPSAGQVVTACMP